MATASIRPPTRRPDPQGAESAARRTAARRSWSGTAIARSRSGSTSTPGTPRRPISRPTKSPGSGSPRSSRRPTRSRGSATCASNWPWLGVVNIWYFRQVGDIPQSKGEFYFRMVDPELTVRRVYTEVVRATEAQRLALPGALHVHSRPTLTAKGRWTTPVADRHAHVADQQQPRPVTPWRCVSRGINCDRGRPAGRRADGWGCWSMAPAMRFAPCRKTTKAGAISTSASSTSGTETLTVVTGLDPLGAVARAPGALANLAQRPMGTRAR